MLHLRLKNTCDVYSKYHVQSIMSLDNTSLSYF